MSVEITAEGVCRRGSQKSFFRERMSVSPAISNEDLCIFVKKALHSIFDNRSYDKFWVKQIKIPRRKNISLKLYKSLVENAERPPPMQRPGTTVVADSPTPPPPYSSEDEQRRQAFVEVPRETPRSPTQTSNGFCFPADEREEMAQLAKGIEDSRNAFLAEQLLRSGGMDSSSTIEADSVVSAEAGSSRPRTSAVDPELPGRYPDSESDETDYFSMSDGASTYSDDPSLFSTQDSLHFHVPRHQRHVHFNIPRHHRHGRDGNSAIR